MSDDDSARRGVSRGSDGDEALRSTSGDPGGYLRLPMPAVAAGLLVLIVALLALGVWANRSLRGSSPAAPMLVPTAVVVAAPASATVLPPTVAPPTATPQSTGVLVATATLPAAPSATEQPTPLPTVEPARAAEVGQAYENFWRVRSQALLDLDTTHLSEVMDGDYLQAVATRIDQLRRDGQAIKTHVILDYQVVQADDVSARIVDNFEDDSVYVKIGTEDPLSDPDGGRVSILFKMRKLSDAWKVIDSVRSE